MLWGHLFQGTQTVKVLNFPDQTRPAPDRILMMLKRVLGAIDCNFQKNIVCTLAYTENPDYVLRTRSAAKDTSHHLDLVLVWHLFFFLTKSSQITEGIPWKAFREKHSREGVPEEVPIMVVHGRRHEICSICSLQLIHWILILFDYFIYLFIYFICLIGFIQWMYLICLTSLCRTSLLVHVVDHAPQFMSSNIESLVKSQQDHHSFPVNFFVFRVDFSAQSWFQSIVTEWPIWS